MTAVVQSTAASNEHLSEVFMTTFGMCAEARVFQAGEMGFGRARGQLVVQGVTSIFVSCARSRPNGSADADIFAAGPISRIDDPGVVG
jgi:hypothetical protein